METKKKRIGKERERESERECERGEEEGEEKQQRMRGGRKERGRTKGT
jgi:hypothetical protein